MVGSVQILPLYLDSSCWETSSSSPLLNSPSEIDLLAFSVGGRGDQKKKKKKGLLMNSFLPLMAKEGDRFRLTCEMSLQQLRAAVGMKKKKEGRDERRKK